MNFIATTFIMIATLFSLQAQADTWESMTDRPGFDYRDMDLVAERPVVCQWQCQRDPRCKAWTYVKPGYQGPKPRCWLKYAVPAQVPNRCCTSGIIN